MDKEPRPEIAEPKPLGRGPDRRSRKAPSELNLRVREACRGMTLREVAAVTGVSKEAARRYMSVSPPSVEFLASLCLNRGISAEWLLCERGTPDRHEERRRALREASLDELYSELMSRLRPIQDEVSARGGGTVDPSGRRRVVPPSGPSPGPGAEGGYGST